MAVIEPASMVEVILERAVNARLRHEVVPDIQDATVVVADLGGMSTEGGGKQRDGESHKCDASFHRVFLLNTSGRIELTNLGMTPW